MESWEIIKCLEEGGLVKNMHSELVYDRSSFQYSDFLDFFINKPWEYEIVKPKKKIKLYRHTLQLGSKYKQLHWENEKIYTNFIEKEGVWEVIKTEEKEIEVEE